MLTSSHRGAAAVTVCGEADADPVVAQIVVRRSRDSAGLSRRRTRDPPVSVAGHATGE
jgi:hypothetical protein